MAVAGAREHAGVDDRATRPAGDGTARPAGEGPTPLRPPASERERVGFAAVLDVARSAGLATTGAGVWRAGSAVLVGLPSVPALARVDDPVRAADAERQVSVSSLLAARGVPAVRTIGPHAQPVPTPAGPVTVWEWVPADGPPVGAREIGHAARRLHDTTRDVIGLVVDHDPLEVVAAELARARRSGGTPAADVALLDAVRERLAQNWPQPADDPLGGALVHGDLHRGNVIAGREGVVLADLELSGWGPGSADVAPQLVAVRRYGGDPAELEAFLAGYGADPRGWDGLEVLVEGYELWVAAWAVANRAASPRIEHEAEVRLRRWRGGEQRVWSLR